MRTMESEPFRQILQRAEEIQAQSSGEFRVDAQSEQLIAAAIEAGLSREAVVQAMQERFALEHRTLEPGALVFALSSDQRFYPAHLQSLDAGIATVRFVNGSDHTLRRGELRPFALLPGQTVNAQWPNWGWWNCKVIAFDRELLRVRLSDGWGSEENLSISDIRLNPEKVEGSGGFRHKIWMIVSASAVFGGVVGALLMRLLG